MRFDIHGIVAAHLFFLAVGWAAPVSAQTPTSAIELIKQTEKDIDSLRVSAEQGNATAQHKLGWAYAKGDGVPKDPAQAAEWWRKAAEQGLACAQHSLGWAYNYGDGVPKNAKLAAEWSRKSAEQGYTAAQNSLGVHYRDGNGVPKDYIEAYMWFNIAASDSVEISKNNRDLLANRMTQEQIAEAQQRSAAFKPKTWDDIQAASLEHEMKGTGTAFFISFDGYAVTAAHVAQAGTRVELVRDGSKYPAQVVVVDAANDLAVLKAEGVFGAVALGSSAGVALGVEVCTVGFPNAALQGASPKATRGNVNSLLGIQDDPRYFQISAQINPGSSGGALIDTKGSVVGVVVALLDENLSLSVSGALPQNVNYAVKIAYLMPLLESVPGLSASLKKTEIKAANTPEEAIANLEQATCQVLIY